MRFDPKRSFVTTVFHYSLNGQIIAESNSAGNITAEYVYLNGQPLAKIAGTNTYYYHNDHLATPQKMTDASGVVVWSADYKPFGEATVTVSTITNNLRFPGQYYDAETGLNYNLNRDYNPMVGRYLEVDPLGLAGGINPYRYVNGNPLRFTDPLGLFCTFDFVTHYYAGGGTAIDLGAVGLLGAFQNAASVQGSVNSFKDKARLDAASKAGSLCKKCDKGTKSGSFSLQDKDITNVTGDSCLFAVGHSTFFRSGNCSVSANCSSRTFSFSCSTSFSIRDWFQDPIDLGTEVGGTPYQINAGWSGSVSGSGSF